MSIGESIILGIVQGITEFIPISSSGHLILVRHVLSIDIQYALAFDILLHGVTFLVVVFYFRNDIARLLNTFFRLCFRKHTTRAERTLLLALGVGTVPAVIVGLLGGGAITAISRTPLIVALSLIAGSIVLGCAEYFSSSRRHMMTVGRGALVGVFQVAAFIPGVSRSGITIAGGLFAGFDRVHAARFSFLLSLPLISGVVVTKGISGGFSEITSLGVPALTGALAACVSGFIAIHMLIVFLRSHRLYTFVIYRIVLAIGVVLLLM